MKTPEQTLASLSPRERILVTAHALFYREGIRATGVDRIIEQSSVSKVTFYRQYASKDELIRAYLDDRHARWMAWFRTNLEDRTRAGSSAAQALVATLHSWFMQADYRGCAFLNAAAELGSSDPGILARVCEHKQEMVAVLDVFFSPGRAPLGPTLALLIDGAIVHVQMGRPVDRVLNEFQAAVQAIAIRRCDS